MTAQYFIAIPAWTPPYVDLAVRYTVPSVLAALDEAGDTNATFVIHTDDQKRFSEALAGRDVRWYRPLRNTSRDGHWLAFKQAHKDALNATPNGAITVLLNSDIVMSRETFRVVREAFEQPQIKTVVSVGIRTAIEKCGSPPPIGATADELARWIWDNPHHLTQECIWGRGRSQHPTLLFFEDDGAVTMHGVHLTPMFIRKERPLPFKGTIDDDLLANFQDDEVRYLADGEAMFAELSPEWKKHPFGRPLTVDGVCAFGHRRLRAAHVRNFKQRMKVLGNPTRNHPVADEIIGRLRAST